MIAISSVIWEEIKNFKYIFCFLFLFRDGTTDVTRTFHFGEPSPYQKVSTILNFHIPNTKYKCYAYYRPDFLLLLSGIPLFTWPLSNFLFWIPCFSFTANLDFFSTLHFKISAFFSLFAKSGLIFAKVKLLLFEYSSN